MMNYIRRVNLTVATVLLPFMCSSQAMSQPVATPVAPEAPDRAMERQMVNLARECKASHEQFCRIKFVAIAADTYTLATLLAHNAKTREMQSKYPLITDWSLKLNMLKKDQPITADTSEIYDKMLGILKDVITEATGKLSHATAGAFEAVEIIFFPDQNKDAPVSEDQYLHYGEESAAQLECDRYTLSNQVYFLQELNRFAPEGMRDANERVIDEIKGNVQAVHDEQARRHLVDPRSSAMFPYPGSRGKPASPAGPSTGGRSGNDVCSDPNPCTGGYGSGGNGDGFHGGINMN